METPECKCKEPSEGFRTDNPRDSVPTGKCTKCGKPMMNEHIAPTIEKIMCDTLLKVLEEIQKVSQAHNNELIELWKRIDALERKVYNEM